ncbi:hypothetical protein DW172_03630 [Agathobacter rectalis]|uniref:Uncharacterized protein n=1 Tax=Agathobacter rectalis TaxID=39491 RepID=A0A414ZRE7_9FIRM|nr:hypothetical protein [Agathobacter rectalis]RHI25784.1 hypothetical protein DW172_03630 [Agathobacter rectalis]
MTIEEMRNSMLKANVYTKADIDKICELEQQYRKECKEIAEQCEAEGYPANGSNYELRCSEARKYYDEQIEIIDANYEM